MIKVLWTRYKSRFIDYIAIGLLTLTASGLIFAQKIKSHDDKLKDLEPKVIDLVKNKQDYKTLTDELDSLGNQLAETNKTLNKNTEATEKNTDAVARVEKKLDDEHKENQDWFRKIFEKE